ncbi:MAG: hypothetical protein E7590_04945 [Ruminococcaceae bacterium]|nr:hypothetical protein [Oscillospiraceae bacterium]
MEEKKTNYGKIIAITMAVVAAASAIAYVIYRLCRNFFTFCDSYREDEIEDTDFDFDEIDEEELDDNFIIVDDDETAEEAPAEETTEA